MSMLCKAKEIEFLRENSLLNNIIQTGLEI